MLDVKLVVRRGSFSASSAFLCGIMKAHRTLPTAYPKVWNSRKPRRSATGAGHCLERREGW